MPRSLLPYAVAVGGVVLALGVRLVLGSVLGNRLPYILFFPAIALSAHFGGLRAGLLATVLGAISVTYFLLEPTFSLAVYSAVDAFGLLLYLITGVVFSALNESLHRSRRRVTAAALKLRAAEARSRVTLTSIGDAVIVADLQGRVTFINPVAEALAGWPADKAVGQPLDVVLPLFHERNRRPAESPLDRVLREGTVIGLGRTLLLRSRESHVRPVDESAAPIRDDRGNVLGVVVVFRDVAARRQAEAERAELLAKTQTARRDAEAAREQVVNILESLSDGFVAVDRNWRFTFVNAAAERLLDKTRTELVGHDLWGEYAYLLGTVFERECRRTTAEQVSTEFELESPKTGRLYEVRTYPARDGGSTIYFRDASERKQAQAALRRSEARARRLFESNVVGVIHWDFETGRITDANDVFLHMTGHSRDDLRAGRVRWDHMTPPDWRERNALGVAEIRAKRQGLPYEKEYFRKDGGRVPIIIGGALFDDSECEGVSFVLDISDRKRFEEELREADRRKDEFLAMLGHELRNPLAPIRTAAEVLRQRERSDPEAAELHAMIDRQVRQLTRLVDDLLDMARINRGKIDIRPERVVLGDAIGRAVETVQPLLDERGHRLTVRLPDAPVWLEADPARLAQVFANLLSNAVKYTPPGGQVLLEAEVTGEGPASPGEVVVRLTDSGIGIRPEALPHLFELFTQADCVPGRLREGLGIGLTLVRRLVELHGGRVSAFSEGPDRGSTFTVTLPRSASAEARAEPATPTTNGRAGPGLNVLVVDDNHDAANSLAMLLRLDGHAVRVAHDGPSALAAAQIEPPDAVFLDIGLPLGMDGYAVARELRAGPATRPALLIALTGYGQEDDRKRSRESGFDVHLVKPVDPAEVDRLLAARRTPG